MSTAVFGRSRLSDFVDARVEELSEFPLIYAAHLEEMVRRRHGRNLPTAMAKMENGGCSTGWSQQLGVLS